jgi:hypothetical protein
MYYTLPMPHTHLRNWFNSPSPSPAHTTPNPTYNTTPDDRDLAISLSQRIPTHNAEADIRRYLSELALLYYYGLLQTDLNPRPLPQPPASPSDPPLLQDIYLVRHNDAPYLPLQDADLLIPQPITTPPTVFVLTHTEPDLIRVHLRGWAHIWTLQERISGAAGGEPYQIQLADLNAFPPADV